MRRATGLLSPTDPRQTISIHALLAESDHVGAGTIQTPSQISIHALLAESDQLRFLHNLFAVLFLSTLSLRRATRTKRLGFRQTSTISIHALLAESDRISLDGVGVILISIHALLAESDAATRRMISAAVAFLSTLSLRRATVASKCSAAEMTYFYPRSPCGERRNKHTIITGGKHFYPRSPCGERPAVTTSITLSLRFLSTLSLRRATQATFCHHWDHHISIHALLAESDAASHGRRTGQRNFYPRSPCGERHQLKRRFRRANAFLSTLSLRRATPQWLPWLLQLLISIHALLAESDFALMISRRTFANFYPRSPCGERRHYLAQPQARHNFYPRSPCGERPSSVLMALPSYIFLSTLSLRRATVDFSSNARATLISIHALLAESDMPISTSFPIALNFYPHSPCGERRWRCSCRRLYSNFYPRSPCGERRHSCRADAGDQPISIHALLAESDAQRQSAQRQPDGFLSTLSLRRATGAATNTRARHLNFYPRSPCGERRNNSNNELVCTVFLSTLSLRRATVRD